MYIHVCMYAYVHILYAYVMYIVMYAYVCCMYMYVCMYVLITVRTCTNWYMYALQVYAVLNLLS